MRERGKGLVKTRVCMRNSQTIERMTYPLQENASSWGDPIKQMKSFSDKQCLFPLACGSQVLCRHINYIYMVGMKVETKLPKGQREPTRGDQEERGTEEMCLKYITYLKITLYNPV